jgi:hypothetical protein
MRSARGNFISAALNPTSWPTMPGLWSGSPSSIKLESKASNNTLSALSFSSAAFF